MARFSDEAKVGLVVFIAAAILVTGLLYLEGYRIKKRGYVIYAVFDNVGGLGHGDPVTVAGLRVGNVQRMILFGNKVKVGLWVNSWVKLPRNSIAYIRTVGVMGEKEVQIKPGSSSEMLREGDVIQGGHEADIAELTAAAGSISEDLQVILNRLRTTLDKDAQEDIKSSLSNIRKISSELGRRVDKQINDLNEILSNLKSTSRDFNSLSKTQRKNIESLIHNIQASTVDLKEASGNLKKLSNSLENILGRLERGEGTLGKLLTEESLYDNMEKLSRDLDDLVNDIKKNPRKYIHIEIF